jgi:hypothetical protein
MHAYVYNLHIQLALPKKEAQETLPRK